MRRPTMLLVLAVAAACGGDTDARATAERTDARATAERTAAEDAAAASSPAADREDEEPLCDRTDDDEALTPAVAEPLEIPGVREANTQRRCMLSFGVDMAIADVRRFYRTTLPERGYEIVRDAEEEGIVTGNLSRTSLRATKPGRQASVQIDEFDPEPSALSEHRVNVRLQLDAVRQ